jgi:hypothetical protein
MEFRWLKRIDFFPPRPGDLAGLREICIGTKSRNLGDALALTTLPAKLRARFPDLVVKTYPRAFNPIVFRGNPHVAGVSRLPDAVHGDDTNWGEGQLIQLKERYFGLPVSDRPRPELHLSAAETAWAKRLLADKLLPGNQDKPVCILHPWGATNSKIAPVEFWDALVARWNGEIRFWQVGIEGHGAVQGCEYYLFLPSGRGRARDLFALSSEADLFVGVDSGPMHVARAFDLPSLVIVNGVDPVRALADRRRGPYFLYGNWRNSTLYGENVHADVGTLGERGAHAAADAFFGKELGNA